MKRIILVGLVFIGFSCSVNAAKAPPIKEKDDWMSRCKSLASVAEQFMTNRQHGVAMSDMMDIVKSGADLHKHMVINAYNKPRYELEENQEREIAEFRDFYYLACAKNHMK